ncbi:MAG TPA: hypothetical protein VHJ82_01545 [Actinomycetota bacterium]|nr:hypothetical protein [Actinomycetota bacterium]
MSLRPRVAALLSALLLSACSTGINAGGKTLGSNGGTAFVVMAVMLVLLAATLWYFIGRED